MNKGIIIRIILKTTPHNYLALLIVYKALPAFSPEPRKQEKFSPHFTEEELRAPEGKHFASCHTDCYNVGPQLSEFPHL